MSSKKLYALTESDVAKLAMMAKGFQAVSTRLGHLDDVQLNRGFVASLTPLDQDAAVERMAQGAYSYEWRDFPAQVDWDVEREDIKERYRSEVRAALGALLQESE